MGPTVEISLEKCDDSLLDAVDTALASIVDTIERTRKGRVWNIWVRSRPVHVSISESSLAIQLTAGCNEDVDYVVLQEVTHAIVQSVGGEASEPVK